MAHLGLANATKQRRRGLHRWQLDGRGRGSFVQPGLPVERHRERPLRMVQDALRVHHIFRVPHHLATFPPVPQNQLRIPLSLRQVGCRSVCFFHPHCPVVARQSPPRARLISIDVDSIRQLGCELAPRPGRSIVRHYTMHVSRFLG